MNVTYGDNSAVYGLYTRFPNANNGYFSLLNAFSGRVSLFYSAATTFGSSTFNFLS